MSRTLLFRNIRNIEYPVLEATKRVGFFKTIDSVMISIVQVYSFENNECYDNYYNYSL